jgi:hypothetical protein
MASRGSTEDQKREVTKVAETLFGVPFGTSQVIGETLERATPEIEFGDPQVIQALRATIDGEAIPSESYAAFREHPLASWIESAFGVRAEEGTRRLVRQAPRRLEGEDSSVVELARLTSTADPSRCANVLRRFLLKGAELRASTSRRFGCPTAPVAVEPCYPTYSGSSSANLWFLGVHGSFGRSCPDP